LQQRLLELANVNPQQHEMLMRSNSQLSVRSQAQGGMSPPLSPRGVLLPPPIFDGGEHV
jgi:hypothetical protein